MIFYSLSLCRDIFHCHKNHYSYSSKADVFTVGHWAGATRATYPQGSNIINKLCLMTPVIPLGVTLFQMICTYVMIAHVACDLPRICRRYSFTLNLCWTLRISIYSLSWSLYVAGPEVHRDWKWNTVGACAFLMCSLYQWT